jgi:hypothetical protein
MSDSRWRLRRIEGWETEDGKIFSTSKEAVKYNDKFLKLMDAWSKIFPGRFLSANSYINKENEMFAKRIIKHWNDLKTIVEEKNWVILKEIMEGSKNE